MPTASVIRSSFRAGRARKDRRVSSSLVRRHAARWQTWGEPRSPGYIGETSTVLSRNPGSRSKQIGQVEPGLWVAQAFGGHGVAPTTFAGEIVAAAIAEGDGRWREFSAYGLVSAMKPAGFLGAQLGYWWAQAKDAWKARAERSMRA